jgi:hypothetical protein
MLGIARAKKERRGKIKAEKDVIDDVGQKEVS